jgi:hypothetical protein
MTDYEFPEIALADAIAAVRRDLVIAQAEGAREEVRFAVGSVDMEFAVDIRREAGGEASVKVLSLLSLGGKASTGRTATTRIKVTLAALTSTGSPLQVGSDHSERPGG